MLRRRRGNAPRRGRDGNQPTWPVLTRAVVCSGCHGGAGTTTLARMLGRAGDAGRGVPNPQGRPLLMVTRGTAHAVSMATTACDVALQHRLRPLLLVVVGDGPWPEPQAVTTRLQLLQARLDHIVRVPYVDKWRYRDEPLSEPPPPPVMRALYSIRDHLEPPPPAYTPQRRTHG